MLVRAGQKYGVDPRVLAIIARKESEFGTTSGRFRNNAWGWGVHLGSDVNTAPSWGVMAERVAKGLAGSLYKGSGLTRIDQIINRYAPPSENDTGLYIKQISDWYRQMGGNPSASVFGGQQSGGESPAGPPPGGGASPPSGGSGIDARALMRALGESREGVLQGQTPGKDFGRNLHGLVSRALANPVRVQPSRPPQQQAPGGGPGHHAGDGHNHGYPTGPVDSGKATPGGQGGNWGGSMPLALALARAVGLPVTSQKRSRQRTASGGVSDHWQGSTTSYAVDLGTSGAAGDAAFLRTIRALGLNPSQYPSGRWHNVNIGGYRYQIGWRTPGHFDHIHVGVKKL